MNNGGNISPLASGTKSFDYGSKSSEVSKNYYKDANNNDSNNDASTETLAYFLEIQSRLNHLQSLLDTSNLAEDSAFHSVSTHDSNADNENESGNGAQSMIYDLHSNIMKSIESMIQSAICDPSIEKQKAQESDFYNQFSDKPKNGQNWSRSSKHQRRPSIEQQIYRNLDYSFSVLMQTAMKFMQNQNQLQMNAITSAVVLYSSGSLFYCLENDANMSVFSYFFGIFLIFLVMAIGFLFNVGANTKHKGNEFMIACIASFCLIYFSIFWLSHYYNLTVSFIFIFALILCYQYKHGPINAKERRLDELWLCVLLNCGLPLFAYYMQLPEITKLPQTTITATITPNDVISEPVITTDSVPEMTNDNSGDNGQEDSDFILSLCYNILSYLWSLISSVEEKIVNNEHVNINASDIERIESWGLWLFESAVHGIASLGTMLMNDFWNMMDITHALDDEDTTAATQSVETAQVQQQQEQVQEVHVEEEVVLTTTSSMMEGAADKSIQIDDTLYWFNRLFYTFPYPLFNMVLISWFITHSAMLIQNVSLYKVVNTKLLYCAEVMMSYGLSMLFWSNNMFDTTLVYWMVLSLPWTFGLLKHVWEHKNITNDEKISYHTGMFTLWFFIAMYLSFVYDWIYAMGIFYALFSPNLLIVIAPFYFIIQCMPQIVDEFVWATDF